ncbi:MAG: sugar ABC transporter permease, partial [Lachnospiraceae bacterium]|nr:sugar ABC transporter permease [Lachnospiraceae bacterium]
RILLCFLLFLINLGNSVILLIATIMGLDADTYEAARIDGCSHRKAFFKVVVPALSPVISYIIITSLVSGIQMFDLPQILTDGQGSPNRSTMTLIMYLNRHLLGNNYGLAGALSVYLFLVCGILSFFIYRILNQKEE